VAEKGHGNERIRIKEEVDGMIRKQRFTKQHPKNHFVEQGENTQNSGFQEEPTIGRGKGGGGGSTTKCARSSYYMMYCTIFIEISWPAFFFRKII
jgi:hypothetical protein